MVHIHRAEREDGLVQALGDVVAEALDDPIQNEVVAVPTRGDAGAGILNEAEFEQAKAKLLQ